MNVKDIVNKMTLEEKASICSGLDFWHTKAVERLGIENIMLTDGPHGLRKQSANADHLGINESVKAVCFPPACATGNSFDVKLIEKMGEALGEECIQEDVSVILGPGLNIKRSPLCGRNFEYFSEDPLLSGKLAAALVRGIQSKNVGACLKHFAANNQETARMVNDSIVDERALREIYLKGFEIAVKESQPKMVMCSYNKINSVYACENEELLTSILRKEWGFDGAVVTDWGALDDKIKSLKAGLDLEMPSSNGETDKVIIKAVKKGELSEKTLDRAVERILKIVIGCKNQTVNYDESKHHALAKEIAISSAVLLKNEDKILPLTPDKKCCIVGQFAKKLKFQGGGSSIINPTKVDNICDIFNQKGIEYDYYQGYDLNEKTLNQQIIDEAVEKASQYETVIIFAGLPDSYESEGFDRTNIELPISHNQLIKAIAENNKNVIVALINGSVVNMPWSNDVKAIITFSLSGQAGGSAIVDLLYGEAVPSGRLSESYINDINDNPSHLNFGKSRQSYYMESIYVGYRYYNTAKVKVAFPFGYGLSYCDFEYSKLAVSKNDLKETDTFDVSVKITNNGTYDAYEVVQLYAQAPSAIVARPERELIAFDKVFIEANQTCEVKFTIPVKDLSFFDSTKHCWKVEGGEYKIIIGKNATESILEAKVNIEGNIIPSIYKNYLGDKVAPLVITKEKFESVFGKELPKVNKNSKPIYDKNSTLADISHTPFGKKLYGQTLGGIKNSIGNAFGEDLSNLEAMLNDMPLRSLAMFSGGAITSIMLEGFILILNGKKLRGLIKVIKGTPKKKK